MNLTGETGNIASNIWHIITPEYPPDCGGVSDYVQHLACGLRDAASEAHVWCPDKGAAHPQWVHQIPGGFNAGSLKILGAALDKLPKPRRLLVQWVPHGYGYASLNLPFCVWLWWRARRGDRVEIMLHEAFLWFFQGNWRQDAAAIVHRLMTIILIQAASWIWMSTESWQKCWKPYALGRRVPFRWLPLPTSIPVQLQTNNGAVLKSQLAPPGTILAGHFGTYGMNVGPLVERIAVSLLSRRKDVVLLLMGQSSETFRESLIGRHPELASQVVASGRLERQDASRHLQACDLLIQPFGDGANARRTSLISGLAHGAAIITTLGTMTEPFWRQTDAVVAVPVEREDLFVAETERLLDDPAERARLRSASRRFYDDHLDLRHAVEMLRGSQDPNRAVEMEPFQQLENR